MGGGRNIVFCGKWEEENDIKWMWKSRRLRRLDNESEINHHLNKYCSKNFPIFFHICDLHLFDESCLKIENHQDFVSKNAIISKKEGEKIQYAR